MAIDIVTLALSKKYTDDTAEGMGAVKGAPCTVKSIVDDESSGVHIVTFEWNDNEGGKHTSEMTVKDGKGAADVEALTQEQMNKLMSVL
ncbi:MAG: hypothetical protein IJ736_14280 [Firmicutes bacterium]|nr:hypothetical protein [Bacillota bacterium]